MGSADKNNKLNQFYIFLIIIVMGVVVTTLLLLYKPKAERKAVETRLPEVNVVVTQPTKIRISVESQGIVKAKVQIKLIAEVSGKVVEIGALENSGGFFKQNELLLRINDADYTLAIARAEAQVAAAQQSLARVEAEAEQARSDLQLIGRHESKARAYALREPQLKEAQANLKAALADLSIAKLQQQRTLIRAPFNGRVINKQVDVGQYVVPGNVMAEIYSVESMEVRLPLSQSQLSLLDVPLEYENESLDSAQPAVLLTAEFAGRQWRWKANIVRTDGMIDMANQLLYAVAEVDHPYRRDSDFPQRPPLIPGLFVKARIQGRLLENIYVLPRTALRYGREIWLLDKDNNLQKRKISVLHKDQKYIYVTRGLEPEEKVIISALDVAIPGMQLAPVSERTVDFDEMVHE